MVIDFKSKRPRGENPEPTRGSAEPIPQTLQENPVQVFTSPIFLAAVIGAVLIVLTAVAWG